MRAGRRFGKAIDGEVNETFCVHYDFIGDVTDVSSAKEYHYMIDMLFRYI